MTKNKKSSKTWRMVVVVIIVLVIGFFFMPKYVQRYFIWNFADIGDGEKFPKLEVHKGSGEPFRFTEPDSNFMFSVPEKFDPEQKAGNFESFLDDHDVVAFVVIVGDTLVYEKYFKGFNKESTLPSFSVSKSFVSALTGIAIDEGYIYSTSQPITFFLKELGPDFKPITIEDLLNMRSGIDFDEGYSNPFAEMPKYYYGTDLLKYITKLKIREKPDLHYDYISVNTLLLGLIVERATNTKLSTYLEQKIWMPLNMESDASWNIDSEKDKTIKAFCCINAIARDFAKFGRLYKNKGNWNGKQVVPEKWVVRSTSIINDSRDSQGYPYTYQWRVLENGAFFAKGILGQYIFVWPEKDLVCVRLGSNYGEIDWADFFINLADQLPDRYSENR